jgi:hypothetical protein
MPPTTYIDIARIEAALQIKINNLVHCPSVKRMQDFA